MICPAPARSRTAVPPPGLTVPLAIWLALGQAAILPSAPAQIVADPGAPGGHRPTVLGAGNGVPVINIQTPNEAGLSHNMYGRFDVPEQGAILNNSRTDVQSQLGGWVQGNPWLATGSASVILNEINSRDPSLLRGFIEVAGEREPHQLVEQRVVEAAPPFGRRRGAGGRRDRAGPGGRRLDRRRAVVGSDLRQAPRERQRDRRDGCPHSAARLSGSASGMCSASSSSRSSRSLSAARGVTNRARPR